jgi:maltooligosyltrehalose trehalohydrolase
VVINEARAPMTRSTDPHRAGWWEVTVADAGHGTDYAFSVDGSVPRPDPRSAWQPTTVHESSRVFDTGVHEWSDEAWPGLDIRGQVFYELHIGTFTAQGTLDAAIQRLPHLVRLGVDVVELMPVAAFPGRHGWGYDGVAWYAVHDAYGGPAALQRFVDACHSHDLAVCLDVVYNHFGPAGNYVEVFGPYFTDRHHTPWGKAVNLDDADNQGMRRFICDNALRWFRDFHIDALRLDAVHELADDSDEHILAQLSRESGALSEELGRPLGLIAESDVNDPRTVRPRSEGGLGMTAQWADDVHHALHAALTGEKHGYYVDFGDLPTLAKALTEVFVHDGGWSTFRKKPWGAKVDRGQVGGHRFVAYAANHDQIGNRAIGDRPAATVSPGRVAIGAALTMTSAYTPMLFMGEEWASTTPFQFFSDHEDDELGEAIRTGRRAEFAEFGWDAEDIPDPQDHATRDASVLRWTDLDDARHQRMLRWYHELIATRGREPDLRDDALDRVEVAVDEQAQTLVMTRGTIRVVVNLSAAERAIDVGADIAEEILSWDAAQIDGNVVRLQPDSVSLVRL